MPDEARRAGRRVHFTTFVGFKRSPSEILLVCSRDLLAPTLKRLSMFVLRAKAKLTDATADFSLFGLAGDATKEIAGGAHTVWAKADFGSANVVTLYPAGGQPRALWIAPAGEPAPVGTPLATELWLWSEVRSGIVTLTTPLVDAFVPQMLNYESVGGVNFKKGCYPGQEIVARSQYLGKLKRRMALATLPDAAARPGDEVFSVADPDQPSGMIVNAAPNGAGGADALVEIKLAALDGEVRHGSAGGTKLDFLPLPYALDVLEV